MSSETMEDIGKKLEEIIKSLNVLIITRRGERPLDVLYEKREGQPSIYERIRALEVKVNILAFIGGAVLVSMLGLLFTHIL